MSHQACGWGVEFKGACIIMVIVIGNGLSGLSSTPGWGCVSFYTDALEKGMKPAILFSSYKWLNSRAD